MKLAMGCDPAAYLFYRKLLERMRGEGYDIVDVGCESENEADGGKYAEIAEYFFVEQDKEWQWQPTRYQVYVQSFVMMCFRLCLVKTIITEMYCALEHGLWKRKELILPWQ